MDSQREVAFAPVSSNAAATIARLGLCLGLGFWSTSLLTLFGLALLESLTSMQVGRTGWVMAWGSVTAIQIAYFVTLVVVTKSASEK